MKPKSVKKAKQAKATVHVKDIAPKKTVKGGGDPAARYYLENAWPSKTG
jgi:hypothetical protein